MSWGQMGSRCCSPREQELPNAEVVPLARLVVGEGTPHPAAAGGQGRAQATGIRGERLQEMPRPVVRLRSLLLAGR